MSNSERHILHDYVMPVLPFALLASFIFLEPWERMAEFAMIQRDGLDVESLRPSERCANAEGDASLRELLSVLDPDYGPQIRVDVYEEGPFLVAAAGKDRIMVTQAALSSSQTPLLAALLAHEISHLKARNEDFAELGDGESELAVLDVPTWRSSGYYTQEEEELADQDAMDMLIDAQIPFTSAVVFYNYADYVRQPGGHYAHAQLSLHPGISKNRAGSWQQMVDENRWNYYRALDRAQEISLRYYCGHAVFAESRHARDADQ